MKKRPRHAFVDIGQLETCAKFQQKILNYSVVGARQSFQIFRQTSGFSKTIELCLNFCVGIALLNQYYQIIEKLVRENQFQLNHASHLEHSIRTSF